MTVRFFVLALILAANGFFAAAEVALVSVRQSRIREMADAGNAGAQAALSLLANPGRLLSVTQVGITLASLGVGWAGEDTLYRLLRSLFDPLQLHLPTELAHAIAFGIAFLAISFCHVIVGEVVPKNLAIQKADRLAVLVSPALLVFYRISQPFVYVIERTSAIVLRALGITDSHSHGGHSAEELKYIIQSIRKEGQLQEFEEESIQRIIELSEYSAREIMTPRHNIVSLPVEVTLETAVAIAIEHQFTRMPVYEHRQEQIIGIVHYKDLMLAWQERGRPLQLRRLVRKPMVVPETKPLNQLVDDFRANQTRMALVVDEFGTITGLVTFDDVLQQIFGDISDEHDIPEPVNRERKLIVDGTTSIRDLETRYQISLPVDGGFETLAGFLLFQFGHIPQEKESLDYEGRRYTIARMDRNRVASVLIESLEPEQSSASPVSLPKQQ